jgi:hypothetical protein
MVEKDHEGDDKDSHKIQQTPPHTSKTLAINNLKTLTPWSC